MKAIIKLTVYSLLLWNLYSYAEVVTDGSVGTGIYKGTLQTLPFDANKTTTISQNMGTLAGTNLFHSFKTFNINSGESVTFTGANNLTNVISRVTGGEISNINGSLKSEIGKANFYFINPAGIFFGADAHIDVPAAFHVSTADTLRFADNQQFTAIDSTASSLSIADPVSFGFLGSSLNNNGLIEINTAQLNPNYINLKTGQTVDLVAGNITIQNHADLFSPSGEIRLIAMQDKGSVTVAKNADDILTLPIEEPSLLNAGNIIVSNSSKIKTEGNGGGRIALWGGETLFTESTILTNNTGRKNAATNGGIEIHSYSLDLNNVSVSANVKNTGNSGNVTVETAQSLTIVNGARIGDSVTANGSAGYVNVKTDTLIIDKQNSINQTGIFSTNTIGNGNSGNVEVNAKKLTIFNGGKISSSTLAGGNAANIVVTANTLKIDNGNNLSDQKGGVFSEATKGSTGNAGSVTIKTDALDILNGGQISTLADGTSSGNGGAITINGGKLINLQNSNLLTTVENPNGNGGNINVTSDVLLMNSGAIQANAKGGNGGNINLNLKALIPSQEFLINGGSLVDWNKTNFNVIQASSATGINGNINITAPQLNLSGNISHLNYNLLQMPKLDRDSCDNKNRKSYFVRRSKGGIPIANYFVAPITLQQEFTNNAMPVETKSDFVSSNNSFSTNYPCVANAL